eukprot:30801-Pelagococcus_subviridis.AAC.3
MAFHRLQHPHRVARDVVVVQQRFLHRLADERDRGEVHHDVDRIPRIERALELLRNPDVRLHDPQLPRRRELLQRAHRAAVAAAVVVDDRHRVPELEESQGRSIQSDVGVEFKGVRWS